MKLKFIKHKDLNNGIKAERFLSFYLKRAKMAGIGKHSIILYAATDVNERDDLIDAFKQIQQKHDDCIIVSFTGEDKGTVYIVVLPKAGIIGIKTSEYSSSNKYYFDSSHYKRSLGAEKLMDRIWEVVSYGEPPKGVNKIEVFVSSSGKLYDIAKSKLMLNRNADKMHTLKKIATNTLFGLERIGVTSKWKLDGYITKAS